MLKEWKSRNYSGGAYQRYKDYFELVDAAIVDELNKMAHMLYAGDWV